MRARSLSSRETWFLGRDPFEVFGLQKELGDHLGRLRLQGLHRSSGSHAITHYFLKLVHAYHNLSKGFRNIFCHVGSGNVRTVAFDAGAAVDQQNIPTAGDEAI